MNEVMLVSCDPTCPTRHYMGVLALPDEDPVARCNEAGKSLEEERVSARRCPLQYLADLPRN